MSKQKPSDFDDYLAGKSPLSEIYHRLPSNGPAESIDNAILSAAQDEITKHHASASSKGFKWYVPMALAASLLIAVGIIRFYSTDTDINSEQIADKSGPSQQSIEKLKTDPSPLLSAAGKSSPKRILDTISNLVDKSQIDQAEELYAAFKVLFPHYEIDYQRYPNLKSLKPLKAPD